MRENGMKMGHLAKCFQDVTIDFALGHQKKSCKVHNRLRYFYELKLLVVKPWIYSSHVEFCLDEYAI